MPLCTQLNRIGWFFSLPHSQTGQEHTEIPWIESKEANADSCISTWPTWSTWGHINPLISPENSDTSNTHIFGDYVPRHARYCVLPSIEKLPPFPSFNLPIFAYRFGFSLALLSLHTSLPNRDLDHNTVPRLHDILIAAPMGSIRVEPSLSSDV